VDGFNTRAVRGSRGIGEVAERPLAEPIWQVADYAYESAAHYADVINDRRPGQVYGRYGNPTLEVLAEVLAGLERTDAGWIFSSGMGAVHAVLMHLAATGDRVVAARTLYGGTYGLFTEGAERVGIKVDFVDATDAAAVEAALAEPAAGVFVEMVANPTFEVADLEGIARASRTAGVPLAVDNTVATPALSNPAELGADLVIHSTSKYIGGHHDLMGGAVLGTQGRIEDVRHLAIRYGTTASALESWLALRGVATLGLRMERHSSNAMAVAETLERDDRIERVLYPGLPSHPQNDRAKRLLEAFGGMVAVDLGSQEKAWRFMDALEIARVGSSFGGVRSETTHPATTSHRQISPEDRRAAGIGDGLVRISVGIEDPEDLVADFEQAMERM
jgi:cystathionine beta-lyase/cystathionine gamma-synthase